MTDDLHPARLMRSAGMWGVILALSVLFGLVLQRLHVPAAWILAAIIASALVAAVTHREIEQNRHYFTFVRSIIAVISAQPIVESAPGDLLQFILPGIFATVVTLSIGVVGGLALHRTQPEVSQESGILSMLAGGASLMPPLARELGADVNFVLLTQYLRLLTVSISLPLLAPLMGLTHDVAGRTHPAPTVAGLVVLAVVLLVGEPLGKLLRLPAPAILGPMFLTVAIAWTVTALNGGDTATFSVTIPQPIRILAFMSIGWMAGGGLNMQALRRITRLLPAIFLFIAVLMAGCAATAWVLSQWLSISFLDAYLATSPGGLETVLALSDEAQSGAVVAATQVIRVIGVLGIAGWLPQIIRAITRTRN